METDKRKSKSEIASPVVGSRHVGTNIPVEDHRELKSLLASEGQSIKDWLSKCVEKKLGHPMSDVVRMRGALHAAVERREPWA